MFRVFVSDAAELDESEQVLLTQGFRWGYGAQPPLYTWLQIAVFSVTGVNVLGLALLKMALLFGTCGFLYLSAKEITGEDKASIVATVSMLLVPQFLWESQRDLTHSVLAMVTGAATLWMVARLLKGKTTLGYVILGVCIGLGILSKYNYLFFFVSLVLAAATLRSFRSALLDWRVLLSVVIALVITGFHWHWVLAQGGPGAVSSVHLASKAEAPLLSRLVSPFTSAAFFLIGLVPVYAVFFGKTLFARRSQKDGSDFERLLFRTFALGVSFGAGMAFLCNTNFQVRWMQPILFAVPIYLVLRIQSQLTTERFRKLVLLCGVVGAVVLIVLPVTPVAASITHRPTRLNSPYTALAEQLKGRGVSPGAIIAGSRLVGGNLRFSFPGSTVVAPEFHGFTFPETTECLVVWDATKSVELPEKLKTLVVTLRGTALDSTKAAFVEAPLKYTSEKRMKLGYFVLPKQ